MYKTKWNVCYRSDIAQNSSTIAYCNLMGEPSIVETLEFTNMIYIFFIVYLLPLNCPCHLYGSLYHRMHNWAPHRLVYSKVFVDMGNLFLFWFCLCDLFVKSEDATDSRKRCSRAWTISTRAILLHTMTGNRQKVVERVCQKYRQSKESARSESF